MFLVFPTREEAITADHEIGCNVGMCIDGCDTQRYAQEIECIDGTWALPYPAPFAKPLPPLYTPGEPIIMEDGTVVATGTWTFPTELIDPLLNVVGYTVVDNINPKPAPEPAPIVTEETTTTI